MMSAQSLRSLGRKNGICPALQLTALLLTKKFMYDIMYDILTILFELVQMI